MRQLTMIGLGGAIAIGLTAAMPASAQQTPARPRRSSRP